MPPLLRCAFIPLFILTGESDPTFLPRGSRFNFRAPPDWPRRPCFYSPASPLRRHICVRFSVRVSRLQRDGAGRCQAQGEAAVSDGGGRSGRRGGLLGKRRTSRVQLSERSDPHRWNPGRIQEIIQVREAEESPGQQAFRRRESVRISVETRFDVFLMSVVAGTLCLPPPRLCPSSALVRRTLVCTTAEFCCPASSTTRRPPFA